MGVMEDMEVVCMEADTVVVCMVGVCTEEACMAVECMECKNLILS